MSKRAFSIPVVRDRLLGLAVPKSKSKTNKFIKSFANLIQVLSIAIVFLAIIVGLSYFAPQVYYKIFPSNQVILETELESSVLGGDFNQGVNSAQVKEVVEVLPPQDKNLPEGDWVIISKIGVRTKLIKTQDPEEALNKGVWQVADFGDVGSRDLPMILAAHRYGLKWMWESLVDGETYALRNIFYKLPETEPGDIIEIISDQRRYVYEIYAGEESEEISDYDADLILYTCKYLNSPLRFIRYARLVNLD